MTITVTQNAVTVGAVSATGQSPSKTTLQTGTTAFSFSARLTTGNSPLKTPDGVKLYYASCPYDITAAAAVTELARNAESLTIYANAEANKSFVSTSELSVNVGGYVYAWLEWGKQDANATVTVSLVELP
jgi:hypothetical protein